MQSSKRLIALAVAVGLGSAAATRADDTGDLIKSLKQQIQELDQKVKVLERKQELAEETADAEAAQKKKEAPQISIGQNGFSLKSADGNFGLKLQGLVQLDSRSFFGDHGIAPNDAFLLRRARPILAGTLYHDFDFLFVPDFAGATPQIFDANVTYTYSPALQFKFGKFKSPVGLEQLQSDATLPFNERGLPTALVPNRDLGVQLQGSLWDGLVSYAGGIFNGLGDARNSNNTDIDDDKEFDGRLFFQPFRNSSWNVLDGFGAGLGGSYGSSSGASGLPGTTGGTLPGYATDGQQQFFAYNPAAGTVVANGDHWRLSPQGYYFYGPFGLLGEYAISDQKVANGVASARLEHTAWQVSANWVLTGEDASYNGVVPKRPFDPVAGKWGALQLALRYAELDIDRNAFPTFANPATSAHSAAAWSIGLNWWLNRNVRVLTSFSHTEFQGGGGAGTTAPAAVTRQPEDALFTRLQLSF